MQWSSDFFSDLAINNRMVLWAINAEGTYTYVSENVREVLGYEASELMGKRTFFDLLGNHEREKFLAEALSIASRREPFRDLKNSIRTKDGDTVWFSTSGLPILAKDGTFLGYRGWDIDVTEAHRAQEDLVKMSERLSLAKRAGGMGIWDWNLRTNELHWDKEMWKIFGRNPKKAGTPMEVWTKALHPQDSDRVNREIFEAFDKDIGFKSGFRIVLPDGSVRYLRADGVIQRSVGGDLLRMVGTNWDVTEEKMVELQFLRAQRAEGVGNLASGIAHNLNNALSPILVATELLKKYVVDKEGKRLLGTIEKCTHHSAGLIGEMLSFARGVEGARKEVDLKQILTELVEILRRTFSKNVSIVLRCADDLAKVSGNPSQLQQVFMNICLNARDAMGDNGVLTIRASNQECLSAVNAGSMSKFETNRVSVEFYDDGCGMDEATMQHIFDPFFSTKMKTGGTGLGLASSMGIIKNHGGLIDVRSAPGQGACFEIQLPAVVSTAELSPAQRIEHARRYDSIYFIGTNRDLIKKVRQAMVGTGLRTTAHHSPHGVIEVLKEQKHGARLIVIDETVTSTELEDFLRILPKAQKELPPLILVTSLGHDLPRAPTLSRMHVFYLLCPVGPEAVKQFLFDALAAKRMNRPTRRPPQKEPPSPMPVD